LQGVPDRGGKIVFITGGRVAAAQIEYVISGRHRAYRGPVTGAGRIDYGFVPPVLADGITVEISAQISVPGAEIEINDITAARVITARYAGDGKRGLGKNSPTVLTERISGEIPAPALQTVEIVPGTRIHQVTIIADRPGGVAKISPGVAVNAVFGELDRRVLFKHINTLIRAVGDDAGAVALTGDRLQH